jgi:hypothetical protein
MIPSSDVFYKAMISPVKELYLKIEFYDSKMTYIEEFTKKVTRDDIGSISIDKNRPIRRSFSFSLDNRNGEFTWGEKNLIWIDKRIKLFLGLKSGMNEIEYVPQGVYIMSEPQDSNGFDGKKVSITGQDKAWLMTDKRGKLVNELTIEEGTNIGVAIKILAEKVGETMFNFDDIETTVPYELTYQSGDNIYSAIEELALLGKCQVFYDIHGYLRLQNIDLNEFHTLPVVWSYKNGDKNERFYAGNVRKFDESNLANHIRVLGGSGETAEVLYDLEVTESNELWTDNPYAIEKIGRLTYFHNNGNPDGLITTEDEAKWRAKWELMNRLGYAERLDLNIAPNFLHDAGDVIEIIDNENGVSGKYLLESFQLPLSPQLMTCNCVKYREIITDWNFI